MKKDNDLLNSLDDELGNIDENLHLYKGGELQQREIFLEVNGEQIKTWENGEQVYNDAIEKLEKDKQEYAASEFNKFAHTLYQEPEPEDEGIPMIGGVQFKEPGHGAYDKPVEQTLIEMDNSLEQAVNGGVFHLEDGRVGTFEWTDDTQQHVVFKEQAKPVQGSLFGVGIDPYAKDDRIMANAMVIQASGGVAKYTGPPHRVFDEELLQAMVNYDVPINNEKTRLYLGIDPGKSGGIVALKPDGTVVDKFIMPILGDNLDVAKMYDLFKALHDRYHITVILEDVHSIFGMSAATNWTFGYVCGAIEAVVLCLKLKMVKVAPKTWQKEIWINSDKVYKPKKPEQKNPSIDTKPTSICAAARLFPREDLRGEIIIKYYADSAANRKAGKANKEIPSAKKEPHDGIVDALLMAEYGRRKNL